MGWFILDDDVGFWGFLPRFDNRYAGGRLSVCQLVRHVELACRRTRAVFDLAQFNFLHDCGDPFLVGSNSNGFPAGKVRFGVDDATTRAAVSRLSSFI